LIVNTNKFNKMKVNVKEVEKKVFKPVKLELTFENKRELEVLRAWFSLTCEEVNTYRGHGVEIEVESADDRNITAPIYNKIQDILDDL